MNKRQQQRADTAEAIFATAMRLFASQGFAATTIEQITAAAGVAKGTFFVHFPSKDAVISHLSRMQVERLNGIVRDHPTFASNSFREQLGIIYATLGAGIDGQRELVLLTTMEGFRQRDGFGGDAQGIDSFDALLLPIVLAAQRRGELRDDIASERLVALFRSSYFMAVFEWLRHDTSDFLTLAAQILDLLLAGATPRSM